MVSILDGVRGVRRRQVMRDSARHKTPAAAAAGGDVQSARVMPRASTRTLRAFIHRSLTLVVALAD